MPGEQRTRILDAMDEDDAAVMRQLLSYEEGTAGGLMTPEIMFTSVDFPAPLLPTMPNTDPA